MVISLSEVGLDEQNVRKVSFAGRRGDDQRYIPREKSLLRNLFIKRLGI